jgi:hypothetical protein
MKEKFHGVIGRIATLRATHRLPSERARSGWIRDPRSGLFLKPHVSRNIVVLAGLSMMAKSIQYGHADQQKTIRYMAVGTGNTIPDKDDTALVAEVDRVEIDSWDNADIASDPVVMIAHYLFDTTEGNGSLMECSLQQESTGTPMFCRGLFGIGNISGATKADPCVVTATAHGLADEDKILIQNVSGMTELNDNQYFVDVLTADTFALYTDSDLTASVDSTSYGTYSTGSPDVDTWKLVIPKSTSETLTIDYSLTFPAD